MKECENSNNITDKFRTHYEFDCTTLVLSGSSNFVERLVVTFDTMSRTVAPQMKCLFQLDKNIHVSHHKSTEL